MFLLDANVLITANNQFYPINRIPQFWNWIIAQGEAGELKIPREIFDEIAAGNDGLPDWINIPEHKDALLLDEDANPALVQQVLDVGYDGQSEDFDDQELIKIGRDAFLISYGLAENGRIIATKEVSA